MKDEIEKVLYEMLSELPPNKALMWPDFQVAFDTATGQSIQNHLEDVQAVADELEKYGYVRFETMPNKMPRILKGIHFNEWKSRIGSSDSNIHIGSLSAQNVQIGDGNTINVNLTPEEFLSALEQMMNKPEKAESTIQKLKDQVKEGLSFGETVMKFMAMFQ